MSSTKETKKIVRELVAVRLAALRGAGLELVEGEWRSKPGEVEATPDNRRDISAAAFEIRRRGLRGEPAREDRRRRRIAELKRRRSAADREIRRLEKRGET